MPSTNSPKRPDLPPVQGQIPIPEPEEAQKEGLKLQVHIEQLPMQPMNYVQSVKNVFL